MSQSRPSPPVVRRWVWLAVSAAALASLLAWQAGRVPSVPANAVVRSAVPAANAPALPSAVPAATPATARRLPALPAATAALRREFETTPDLAALAQRLSSPHYAHDAEAQWMLGRIYDYCAPYAWNPAGYARDTQTIAGMRLAAAATMRHARERIASRCAGFTPDDALAQEKILAQRVQAAESGSLAAQAALLSAGQPLQGDADYLRWLIRQILAAQDPEAFVAIAPAMGLPASGQEAYHGEVSGTPLTELAWLVAACRLGQNCSADGTLVTRHCANGGICSREPAQDFETFVRNAGVTRQDEPDLDVMVNLLIDGTELK